MSEQHSAESDVAFDAVHLILCNAGLIDPDADSDTLVDSIVAAVDPCAARCQHAEALGAPEWASCADGVDRCSHYRVNPPDSMPDPH